MIVFARDNINHGIPDRSATVTVTLGDINDNAPDPTNLPNSVSVLEVSYHSNDYQLSHCCM